MASSADENGRVYINNNRDEEAGANSSLASNQVVQSKEIDQNDDIDNNDINDPSYGIDEIVSDAETDQEEKRYTALNKADIIYRQGEQILHTTSVLSLSKAEAILLLHHFKWDASELIDQWFTDEEAVRTKVGLSITIKSNELNSSIGNQTCGICFDEDLPFDKFRSTGCNHYYCTKCWKSYITTSINETGLGCLSLRCPEPNCPASVRQDLIFELVSGDEQRKYFHYIVRSYVEAKKETIKWCPAPGCENAVEFELGGGGSKVVYDVTCDCLHSFCWICGEEAHRPVDCEIVRKWSVKNSSETENTTWISAFCKHCPKCNWPIEKNHGCNHMKCRPPCRYEFCWLCLAPWGHHECNRFNPNTTTVVEPKEELNKLTRLSLLRYSHFYERWLNNHKSREIATQDLKEWQTKHLPKLSLKVNVPIEELEFVIEGWKQIIKCRRLLKWSYAYGYYLLEGEEIKSQLFGYLQGQAESHLERLHRRTETDLFNRFFDEPRPRADEFEVFRKKLTWLTRVTGTYFENLVTALENGLSEVDSTEAERPKRRRLLDDQILD